jgi:hypothetical protein
MNALAACGIDAGGGATTGGRITMGIAAVILIATAVGLAMVARRRGKRIAGSVALAVGLGMLGFFATTTATPTMANAATPCAVAPATTATHPPTQGSTPHTTSTPTTVPPTTTAPTTTRPTHPTTTTTPPATTTTPPATTTTTKYPSGGGSGGNS